MAQIDIVRTAAGVSFDPSTQTVVANDIVFWRNMDPQQSHKIARASGGDLTTEIAAFVDGQDPDTSEEVIIDQNLDYVCADHSSEQGSVMIRTAT